LSSAGASPSAIVFRAAVLIVILVLATWGAHVIRDALDLQIRPDNEQQVHRAIMLGAVAYIGLLALPFVPGAEIGLAMLAAFGPAVAPLIYVCTVAAMTLAYAIGRFLPIGALERLLDAPGSALAVDARAPRLAGEMNAQVRPGGPICQTSAFVAGRVIENTSPARGGKHSLGLNEALGLDDGGPSLRCARDASGARASERPAS